MPQPKLGPAGVTRTTPPAKEIYNQVVQMDTSAGDATGFAAFVLPKGSIPILAFIISSGANVAQTLNVGTTLGGTELVTTIFNNFSPTNNADFNNQNVSNINDLIATNISDRMLTDPG